jgi:hypothetical protein
MLGMLVRTLGRTCRTPSHARSARSRLNRASLVLVLGLCSLAGLFGASTALAEENPPLEGLSALALSNPAPLLEVSGQSVLWKALAGETYYELAISDAPRGTAGRTTRYLVLARKAGELQSYTLELEPGQVAYVGMSAENSPNWSAEEATVTGLSSEEQAAAEAPAQVSPPLLIAFGDTLYWTAVPGVSRYTVAIIQSSGTTYTTTYQIVTGTSYTPPVLPGQTVKYGLAASVPGVAPWAREVTITYPAPPPPPPPPPSVIIGTNDGAGWGTAPAMTILAGHVTWTRVEIGTTTNTVPESLADGFKVLAIAGNTADGTPLSQIEPAAWGAEVINELKTNPGAVIAEAGNEMYYKGGVANPVQYGKMYLAAVNDMKAAGIHIPLLFNMWGDYSGPNGFSSDSNGGGWLRDAVNGVPGLAAAILANGLSSHPYGALGESYDDDNGVSAVAVQESVAHAVLGSTPPFYVTEFGYALNYCGRTYGACSEAEQASKLRSAYRAFLADSHVRGIWVYQSHDDSSGQFGYMNHDNTTRPAFGVVSWFALEQGQ